MKSENNPTAPGRATRPAPPVDLAHGRKNLRVTIPIDWLAEAARLPGRSLHVGVSLLILAATLKTPAVPLSNIAGGRFGLDRNAKYRGLAWLEEAGLVSVQRKLGRSPMVTILDAGRRA